MMERQSNGRSPGSLGSDSTQARPVIVPIPVAREAATTALRSEPANFRQTSWENADLLQQGPSVGSCWCSDQPPPPPPSHRNMRHKRHRGSKAACVENSPPLPCSVQIPAARHLVGREVV